MKYWRTVVFAAIHRMDSVMLGSLRYIIPLYLIFGRINADCADGVAAGVTVTDVPVDGVDLGMFQVRQFHEQCVFGASVSQMVYVRDGSAIPLGLLFLVQKRLGVDFSLLLRLRLPEQYEVLAAASQGLVPFG